MAEKDKKFYWIKLKTEFMQGEIIDFLMSQKNGANYVVLYQMLCIKTINTQGELATKIGDVLIPFDEEKIQRDCKWFDIDTIRVALNLYKRLGLVFEQENGIIKISDFNEIVGNETYWAKQKRIGREKQAILAQQNESDNDVGQSLENVQQPLISNIYISNNLNSNISLKEFCNKYDIQIDTCSPLLAEMDFGLIAKAFEESEYLRTDNQCKFLSTIIKRYQKIIKGFYKDTTKTAKSNKDNWRGLDTLQKLYEMEDDE